MNRPPFSLCWSKENRPQGHPPNRPPFPSVVRLKIDTPNHTGTRMYKTPHKGR